MCPFNSTCIGPIGSQVCVGYANPGEPCSQNSSLVTPLCGFATSSCSGINSGYCQGGHIGDSCFNDTDCGGYNCSGGVCVPYIVNSLCNCFGSEYFTTVSNTLVQGRCINDYCVSGTSCQGNTCQTFLAPGAVCRNDTASSNFTQCPPSYYCVGTSPTDTNYKCIQNDTLTAGKYCGNYNDLCAVSGVCNNMYCAKNTPSICGVGLSCNNNQVCNCNGAPLWDGYGNCQTDPCGTKLSALQTCWYAHCSRAGIPFNWGALYGYSYSKSCVGLNCVNEALGYLACSDAMRMIPGFTVLLFAFITLILNKF